MPRTLQTCQLRYHSNGLIITNLDGTAREEELKPLRTINHYKTIDREQHRHPSLRHATRADQYAAYLRSCGEKSRSHKCLALLYNLQ